MNGPQYVAVMLGIAVGFGLISSGIMASRGQGVAGFIVGAVLCALDIFIGLLGAIIVWAIALVIMLLAIPHPDTKARQTVVVEPRVSYPPEPPSLAERQEVIAGRLAGLDHFLKAGLITDEEHTEQRRRILSEV